MRQHPFKLITLIRQLTNQKTDNYRDLKNIILSQNFPWFYADSLTGMDYFSHIFLERPESGEVPYQQVVSEHLNRVSFVVDEILKHNNIEYKFFIRSNANCVTPDNDVQLSEPHVDHDFPHINVLIYLTNSGGKTYCEDEFHDPKEDDVILMTGEHWGERPKVGRRIILVNTLYT